jgi:hypothetical protein
MVKRNPGRSVSAAVQEENSTPKPISVTLAVATMPPSAWHAELHSEVGDERRECAHGMKSEQKQEIISNFPGA